MQQQLTVIGFNSLKKFAEFVQHASVLAGTSPGGFRSGPAYWEIRQIRRFLAFVEELIEWDFKCARQFLKCLHGRDGVAIFNA